MKQEGLNVKLASLPKGFDPDKYVRAKKEEGFRSVIGSAKGLFDYKMDILLSKHGRGSAEAKAKIISEMLPTIKRMDNAVLRSDYIKRLSHNLSIDEKAILIELKKVKLDYTRAAPAPTFELKQEARAAEKVIAALAMEDAEIARRVKEEFDIEDFRDQRIKKIIERSFVLIDEDKQPTAARLIHYIGDEKMSQFICHLLTEVENIVDREKTIEDCIRWIKVDNLRHRKEELAYQIKEAEKSGNDKEVMALVKKFNNLRAMEV